MPFRDVIVSFKRVSLGGQFLAALPVIAIYDEDVFDVEVVGIYFVPELLILFV